MSTGPKQVGTQTTTTDSTPWNSAWLTDLYNAAESQYNAGSSLYQDPSIKPAYNNYLTAGNTLSGTTAPLSLGAYQNAVTGGYDVTNSPVYNNLYNLGTGNTTTQTNLNNYSSGLYNIAQQAPSTAYSYASQLAGIGSTAPGVGQTYADLTSGYGSSAADAGSRYGGYLSDYAQGAVDTGNRYGDTLSGYGTDAISAGNRYGNTLSGYGTDAISAGNRYGNTLSGYGTDAIGAGQQYGDTLSNTAQGAIDTGSGYGNTLSGYGTAAVGAGQQYGGYLSDIGARTLGSTQQWQQPLLDTAQGKYLLSNPYLDSTYNTAAGAVTRQYQTATAPQSDNKYELAGRYGSGSLTNSRSQNEQNLGSSLSGLASDIYGANYAREREAMNNAAAAGGRLSLSESDIARQAYDSAAKASLQGYSTGLSGLSEAAKAALQGYGTGLTGLSDAAKSSLQGYSTGLTGLSDAAKASLQGYSTGLTGLSDAAKASLQGYSTGLSGLSDAAKAALQGYQTGVTGLSDAARAELQGYQTGVTSANDAGRLALSGLDTSRLAYTGAGTTANAGYQTANDAYKNAGTIDYGNLGTQYNALNALQTGYDAGNRNALTGLGYTGTVNTAQTYPYDTYLKGALGLQDVGQTANNETWTRLKNLSGILGGSIQGDTTSTAPIYGKSNLQTGLDTLKTGVGLGSDASSLYKSFSK